MRLQPCIMIVLGIDPGKTGAISKFKDGRFVSVHDMPISGKRVDAGKLRDVVAGADAAIIESVHSMPRDGHVGAFSFGASFGIVLGVLGALRVRTIEVAPAKWKHDMRVTANKATSRHRATELVPSAAKLWSRVKDDGRAEATLIGLWGWRVGLGNELVEW